MRSIGMAGMFTALASIVALGFYAIIFFVVWKFYQVIEKINQNLAGIRQAMERNGRSDLPPSS